MACGWAEKQAQLAHALGLASKKLAWNQPKLINDESLPESMREPLTVEWITGDGMVKLHGWPEFFAPHLFRVLEDQNG